MRQFIDYVWSFYGPGQIYGEFFGNTLTPGEVAEACAARMKSDQYADGDSFDREAVRDMMMTARKKTA